MGITEKSVFQAVSAEYGITTELIMSRARSHDIADARHMTMYILHEELGYSLSQVAEVFKRSHPTTIYALRKMQFFIDNDKGTRLHFAGIHAGLRLNKTEQQAAEA